MEFSPCLFSHCMGSTVKYLVFCYNLPCPWVYVVDGANLGNMLLKEIIPLIYVILRSFMNSLKHWKEQNRTIVRSELSVLYQ